MLAAGSLGAKTIFWPVTFPFEPMKERKFRRMFFGGISFCANECAETFGALEIGRPNSPEENLG
jgi:hypothetical protein